MFNVGDKVVYPMYGAGVVEDVEFSKDETGDAYYVIKLPTGNLSIKIAAKKADLIGIRPIHSEEMLINEIAEAASRPVTAQNNWNIRYKENLEKIRSGNLSDVAQVAKGLMLRERERGLSGVERKMLNNAKQILVSEIALSKDVAKETAEEFLTKKLL